MKEYKFSRLVNLNTKNIATELIGYASGLNESIAFKELTGKELFVENLKHPSVRGIGKLNKVQKHSFSCDGEYINVEELYDWKQLMKAVEYGANYQKAHDYQTAGNIFFPVEETEQIVELLDDLCDTNNNVVSSGEVKLEEVLEYINRKEESNLIKLQNFLKENNWWYDIEVVKNGTDESFIEIDCGSIGSDYKETGWIIQYPISYTREEVYGEVLYILEKTLKQQGKLIG